MHMIIINKYIADFLKDINPLLPPYNLELVSEVILCKTDIWMLNGDPTPP